VPERAAAAQINVPTLAIVGEDDNVGSTPPADQSSPVSVSSARHMSHGRCITPLAIPP
jgi:pimeloyl-ACP methyl ester carboxylesterase